MGNTMGMYTKYTTREMLQDCGMSLSELVDE